MRFQPSHYTDSRSIHNVAIQNRSSGINTDGVARNAMLSKQYSATKQLLDIFSVFLNVTHHGTGNEHESGSAAAQIEKEGAEESDDEVGTKKLRAVLKKDALESCLSDLQSKTDGLSWIDTLTVSTGLFVDGLSRLI